MRKLIGRISIRSTFVFLSIVLQFLWFFIILYRLNEYSQVFTFIMHASAVILAVKIAGTYDNSSFRLAWIMVILLAPVFGILIYIFFGSARAGRRVRIRYNSAVNRTRIPKYDLKVPVCRYAGMMECLTEEGLPVFDSGMITFHKDGEDALESLIADIYNARKYVFMEFFIINEESKIWERFEKALCERAQAGVEVRIIYDALGCIAVFSDKCVQRLRGKGVKIRCFNPMSPWMAGIVNNRDHRKIAIIDGEVAYTGGWNIADEYANITSPYGHWKDCGIRICGNPVEGFVCMYVMMWNFVNGSDENPAHYFASSKIDKDKNNGYVMVYGNSPFCGKNACRDVYLSLIRNAEKYLYFTTPYFICDDEMMGAICFAARSGVDVRIIVPEIPDKRLVYFATKSYFHELIKSGVKVYRYTPGFIHAKIVICDGDAASVGTVNMDFRSLYLHFENGVVIYDNGVIDDIYNEYLSILNVSTRVEETDCINKGHVVRIAENIFRIIAPML